jgi:hypothetical protein
MHSKKQDKVNNNKQNNKTKENKNIKHLFHSKVSKSLPSSKFRSNKFPIQLMFPRGATMLSTS